MKPFTNMYEELCNKPSFRLLNPPKETFDEFCKSLILTDLLDNERKQLLRGLLNQWEHNLDRR